MTLEWWPRLFVEMPIIYFDKHKVDKWLCLPFISDNVSLENRWREDENTFALNQDMTKTILAAEKSYFDITTHTQGQQDQLGHFTPIGSGVYDTCWLVAPVTLSW